MLTVLPTPLLLLARQAPVLQARPNVTRWQAFGVRAGRLRALPPTRGRLVVHCRSGMVWLTHDGDPRDIVLRANESHRVDSAARLTAFALRGDCALELQLDV